jgi:hypothetical protein
MSDPAAHGTLAFYLAYAHPLFMLATIGLALATLRAGLALRRARRLGRPRTARELARHLRLAKLTLTLVPLGFAAGLASAVWLRGFDALASAHGTVASAALALFLGTGFLGARLERGRLDARDAHALLGILAALAAGAAFGTGFVLLP